MIVYYAIGGGLGHLVRARAVLHTLGVSDAVLVTASPFASDARVTGEVAVIEVPPWLEGDRRGLRRFIAEVVASERAERVIVDAFPAGVLGELSGLDVPVDHVARLLRWPRYARRLAGPLPPIDTTFVLEPLHPDPRAALDEASARREPLALFAPPAPQRDDAAGAALVVHAGPDHEVEALVALARTTGHPVRVARPGGADLDVHPASALFARAAAIVTAAGFNAMRQAAPFRGRHVFVPFPRPLDDQFARADHARGAACATGSPSPARWLQAIQPYSDVPATSAAT